MTLADLLPRDAPAVVDVLPIVDPRPMASLCGWCPDARERTLALKEQGFVVSHGICESCEAKWLASANLSPVSVEAIAV